MGISVPEIPFRMLEEFVRILHDKNEEVNLTAITDEREIWIKHILDSISPASFIRFKPKNKWIDIGTGGGLPGIPLAILFPHTEFVLMDSVQKKAEAVGGFIRHLGLGNATVICERAETLGQDPGHREQYDGVLARAVASLHVLVELGVPLIHPYGSVVCYKGPDYLMELTAARTAIQKLKAELPKIYHYSLPEDMGNRLILEISKKDTTPAIYPRRPGIPNKKPL